MRKVQFICDKCSKEYEEFNKEQHGFMYASVIRISRGAALISGEEVVARGLEGVMNNYVLDLCRECSEDLKNWYSGK